MGLKVYIGGKYYDADDAKISVYDHGLLYGDGVFEGIRAYDGTVFRLDEHIKRLYASARAIALEIPMNAEEMKAAIKETLAVNERTDSYIRVVVTRGRGDLGLAPWLCPQPQVIIITDSIALYPKEDYDNGLSIVTAPTVRTSANALSPRIKSLNYLNNILAKIEARLAGAKEAIMLNQRGEVAECTADNIFIVIKSELHTPPPDAGILNGITRSVVMDIARGKGIQVYESVLTRYDLYVADECLLSGTGAEVIPVTRIDDRPIGDGKPGPMTKMLMDEFHSLVRS